MSLYIGLMSGTSMDGIDAALVDTDTHQLMAGITCPYSERVRCMLETILQNKQPSASLVWQLNTLIGREFTQAVEVLLKKSGVKSKDVTAIGSHGQTIAHDANASIPYSIQLGCPHTIAEQTGITVVADFRTRDLIVGGLGAPFAPLYHQALFARLNQPLAIVNIGGIANITYLSSDNTPSGYDTGPGNCLMDLWIKKQLGDLYDENGQWAASGRVNDALLSRMLTDPYFNKMPPKSIGKEYFSLSWLKQYLSFPCNVEDVQATLLQLTAITIRDAVAFHANDIKKILFCGGGSHNRQLLKVIAGLLPDVEVESTGNYGIDPDYLEAMMFAWLAEKTIHQKTVSMESITGSQKPVILGAVYYT